MTKVIPCEIYVRVCGYMRPVSGFNDGKKAEFHNRVNFNEEKVITIQDILDDPKDFILITQQNCRFCNLVKESLQKIGATGYLLDMKKNIHKIKTILKTFNVEIEGNVDMPILIVRSQDDTQYFLGWGTIVKEFIDDYEDVLIEKRRKENMYA